MISLQLKNGQTISIDLDGASEQLDQLSRSDFQAQLTAVTIHLSYQVRKQESTAQFTLVRPKGFEEEVWFSVERVAERGKVRGGERLELTIGDIKIGLMAHAQQPAARITVVKNGRHEPEESERQG